MAYLVLLIALLVAAIAGIRASEVDTDYQWPDVTDHGSVTTPGTPAFLLTFQHHALIWHSTESLVFQPLDQPKAAVPILMYPDVTPRQWAVAPAGPEAYHMIWQETNGQLRSALVGIDGQTLRGPINLPAGDSSIVLSHSDGRVTVLRTNAQQVIRFSIDPSGRPGPIDKLSVTGVRHIAGALDRDNAVHLAWLTSPTPGQVAVNYQTADSPARLNLYAFDLTLEESISSFALGLDSTHVYLFWGITTATQPDSERIQVLVFPISDPNQTTAFELQMPQNFSPTTSVRLVDPPLGYMAPLPDNPASPAELRWPRPAPAQSDMLPLALSLRTADGWRPAVVYFQGGDTLGYQVIAPYPANVGPLTLAHDRIGDLYLAWTGLNGTMPHLYTATTQGEGLVTTRDNSLETITTGAVFAGFLSLTWFVAPGILMLFVPANHYTVPAAILLYHVSKLVWPPGLFDHIPPLLNHFHNSPPWLVVGGVVFGIALAAFRVLILAQDLQYSTRQQWLAYATTDALLTCLIFGANVLTAAG